MRSSPEFDLISRIRERLGPGAGGGATVGIGDDAAVTTSRGATATSVDALVDGVHFRSAWCPPRAVGHKAFASALSDLAAMGAEAGEAYVWLGLPEWLDEEGTLELCDGLAEVAAAAGVSILGGDLTASPNLALTVTAVGHGRDADAFVGRDGAAVGDAVCVTGSLGGAAAGLMMLEHPQLGEGLDAALADGLRERQLRPVPRLGAGRALAEAGASAMIDLSDGLGGDAEQLAAASGRGIEIEMERVPLQDGVVELAAAAGRDRFELALGGEDYELLCTLPRSAQERAGATVSEAGSQLTEVGRVDGSAGVRLRLPGGRPIPSGGHDHARR